MNFKQYLFTESDCYKENTTLGKYIKPIGICWHSTGANNPKLSRYVGPDDGQLGKNPYNNHWNQHRERRCCPHAWIGKLKDGTIATYQSLPWTLLGWHSGSGKNGNANKLGYIGFEICEDNTKNEDYALAVYKEAVELSAMLCKQYKLDPLGKNVIIDHQEGARLGIASNHADVRHWLGKYGITLDKMRKDIKAEMQGEPEPKPPEPKEELEMWMDKNTLKMGAKGKLTEALQAMLTARGYDVIVIDGDFGAVTDKVVRAYQKDSKLVVDGVVGKQTWEPLLSCSIAPKPEPPKPEPPKEYKVRVNTTRGLNIRADASTSSRVVRTLANGTVMTITKEQKSGTRTWGYAKEYKGWIALDFTVKV